MKELTKKQKKVLLYIKEYTIINGYQPTREQIGKNYNKGKPISGVAITHQIRLMEKKGCVKRMGKSSQIKILVEI